MEEIKRNPLPAMECGMAYLAHPYAPIAKSSKVFAGEIKEANVEETGDIACVFILGRKRYGKNGDSLV